MFIAQNCLHVKVFLENDRTHWEPHLNRATSRPLAHRPVEDGALCLLRSSRPLQVDLQNPGSSCTRLFEQYTVCATTTFAQLKDLHRAHLDLLNCTQSRELMCKVHVADSSLTHKPSSQNWQKHVGCHIAAFVEDPGCQPWQPFACPAERQRPAWEGNMGFE